MITRDFLMIKPKQKYVYTHLMSKSYTVKDFLNEVLSAHPGELGSIQLLDENSNHIQTYNYNNGEVLSELQSDISDSIVGQAFCEGGWGKMDYDITIKMEG